MEDQSHTHLEPGVVEDCPGCEQHILDFSRARYMNLGGPKLDEGTARLQLWYSVLRYTREEFFEVLPNPLLDNLTLDSLTAAVS